MNLRTLGTLPININCLHVVGGFISSMALALVGPNTFPMDSESQELSRKNTKRKFQGIFSQVVLSTSQEEFLQVINVLTNFFGLHYSIMNIIFTAVIERVMKNDSCGSLLSGTCIFKIKHHTCVMKVVHGSIKSSLLNIIWIHLDLPIAIRIVQEKNIECSLVEMTSMPILGNVHSFF